MAEPTTDIDMSVLDELIAIRRQQQQLGAWVARAEEFRPQVEDAVFERVLHDYRHRSAALDEQAAPLKARALVEYAKLRREFARVSEVNGAALFEKAEVEFRHHVGEIDEAEMVERLASPNEVLARCKDELAALETQRARFAEACPDLDLEAAPEPEPEPAAAAPAAAAAAPPPAPAVEAAPPPRPAAGPAPQAPAPVPEAKETRPAEPEPAKPVVKAVPAPPETEPEAPPPPRVVPARPPTGSRPAPLDDPLYSAPTRMVEIIPPAPESPSSGDETRLHEVIPPLAFAPPVPRSETAEVPAARLAEAAAAEDDQANATFILPEAKLVIESEQPPMEFRLGALNYIGRAEDNQVRLSAGNVSRRHAVITVSGNGYAVKDLRSQNGTYVNGDKVDERQLSDGDRLRIGNFELVFRLITPEYALAGAR